VLSCVKNLMGGAVMSEDLMFEKLLEFGDL
jgi:hypothetical protein